MNYIKTAYAQSGSATKQQPSQSSQQPSQPQVGQVFTFNEKSRQPNAPQLCASLASVVKGKAVPDYNLCDVIVYRQAPPIVRKDGMVLNNYSGLGHYIEFAPAVINSTTPFAEGSNWKSYRYNKSSQTNHYANIYISEPYWANTYTNISWAIINNTRN